MSQATHAAVSDFLSAGATIYLPDGRTPQSSTVAKMAAALGIGAPLLFAMPPPAAASTMPAFTQVAPVERMDLPGAEPGNLVPRLVSVASDPSAGMAPPRMRGEMLDFDGVHVPKELAAIILDAARVTGADPVLMMAMADKESSFRIDAKTKSSSAMGLYQFLDAPWLEVVRDYGAKHGLAKEADLIDTVNGKPTVGNAADKARILALRNDPRLSALMACEKAVRYHSKLNTEFGKVSPPQAYIAHFMGLGGAQKLIRAASQTPNKIGANVFPEASKSNPGIFRGGPSKQNLTVSQVHDRLSQVIQLRMDRYSDVEAKVEDVQTWTLRR